MATDVTSIRLPKKDAALIEHLVDVGEFKSKSEFIRFAVKKTINEMLLKEIQEKMLDNEPLTGKRAKEIQKEIEEIRRLLWDQYAEHLS
jgi:Arc/MetJ-type ribon-helix-helix transcriptional regulator